MFKPFWETREPDFVNADLVKWWRDPDITEWCQRPNSNGTVLKGEGWVVRTPEGRISRVVVSDNRIVADDQSMEALCCKIDVLKMLGSETTKGRKWKPRTH